MTLRPITFNAQCAEGQYATVGMGFDAHGHTFAIAPHPWQRNLLLVSHASTGFLFCQVHTDDPEVAMATALVRLTHVGALQLSRAIAKANAMDVPRTPAAA